MRRDEWMCLTWLSDSELCSGSALQDCQRQLIVQRFLQGAAGSGFTFTAERNQHYGQRHCQPLLQRLHQEVSHHASHLPSLQLIQVFEFWLLTY